MDEGRGEQLAPAIGIDLGTTYSCIGVWKHGKVEIVVNGQGNRTTPSYVAFTNSDQLVGDAAKNQHARNPESTVYEVKRLIGRRFSDPLVQSSIATWPFKVVSGHNDKPMIVVQHKGKERRLEPEDISAMFLAYMKEIAEAYLGKKITNAVVTVPAYFNNSQRQATKSAGRKAGLDVKHILNEPTAAAIAYGLKEKTYDCRGDKTVLVFDLGGGTFDVSIILINNRNVKVVATAGDSYLGGVDFDTRLVDHCVRQFERKHKMGISGNYKALRKLRATCERAKRTLSHATEASIELEHLHEDIDFQFSITRAKFENLNMDLFNKCMELVRQCLKDAMIEKDQVKEVVLVGGSTRIPRVQEMLREFFQESKICKGVNPDEAVACGAAIKAAMLGGQESMRFEDVVLRVRDVTPLPLGIGIVGGLMSVVIPKNTIFPVKREKFFTTSIDNQESVEFTVFEGEGTKAYENNFLGEFHLTGIPPMPKMVPQIPVWFEIDTNGILVVSAENIMQNKRNGDNDGKAKITIENGGGWITDSETNDAVVDGAGGNDEAEQQIAANVEARERLERYAKDLRKIIESMDETAPSRLEGRDLVKAIEGTLSWCTENPEAETDAFLAKTTELEMAWSRVVTRTKGMRSPPEKMSFGTLACCFRGGKSAT